MKMKTDYITSQERINFSWHFKDISNKHLKEARRYDRVTEIHLKEAKRNKKIAKEIRVEEEIGNIFQYVANFIKHFK